MKQKTPVALEVLKLSPSESTYTVCLQVFVPRDVLSTRGECIGHIVKATRHDDSRFLGHDTELAFEREDEQGQDVLETFSATTKTICDCLAKGILLKGTMDAENCTPSLTLRVVIYTMANSSRKNALATREVTIKRAFMYRWSRR